MNVFHKIVTLHNSVKSCKAFNTWTHFVSKLIMQFSGVDSVRDISDGLRSATGNLSHFGVSRAPSKSSISYQSKNRTHKVSEDLYFSLLDKYELSLERRRKYALRLQRKIFIMDASIIPLRLSQFDWANFRMKKGVLKLHAAIDNDTGLPSYACMTDGKKQDVRVAKDTEFPEDSVLVMDRA